MTTPRFGPNDPSTAYPQGQDLSASGARGYGYQHTQAVPATVWQITHALGYDPGGLTVISNDGYTIDDPAIQYLTTGQSLRLSFDTSVAGTAYLS
jgi:hypothetical protein